MDTFMAIEKTYMDLYVWLLKKTLIWQQQKPL